jgi:hypothetical protein
MLDPVADSRQRGSAFLFFGPLKSIHAPTRAVNEVESQGPSRKTGCLS